MEETPFGEVGLSRRGLLKRGVVAGAGVTASPVSGSRRRSARPRVEAAGARRSALDKVKWISPRGTLDVMDDFNLVVPIMMGYFKALDISQAEPWRRERQPAAGRGGPGRHGLPVARRAHLVA